MSQNITVEKVKNYDIPKFNYTKQNKDNIDLGKIMETYGGYLKALQSFYKNKVNSNDYSVIMAFNFINLDKYKRFYKKCYSEYKLNEDNPKKVAEIAKKFRGSNDVTGTGFSGFFIRLMRISLPLDGIKKFLDNNHGALDMILSDSFDEKIFNNQKKQGLLGAQNEFFKFTDKSKISQDFDKEFFKNFNNLYYLCKAIPDAVNGKNGSNSDFGDIKDDLDLICEKKLSLKSKATGIANMAKRKLNVNAEKNVERLFLKKFIKKIESLENRVEDILDEYENEHEKMLALYNSQKNQKDGDNKKDEEVKEVKEIGLKRPVLSYKRIVDLNSCKKFLSKRKNDKNIPINDRDSRMDEYFNEVNKYIIALLSSIEDAEIKEDLSLKKVREDYGKFLKEANEAIGDAKEVDIEKLKAWNKKN